MLSRPTLRVARPLLARTNASLSTPAAAAAATPAAPPPPSASTSTAGRKRRPAISLRTPREWNRPLAKGVIPAYDLALKYIQSDSASVLAEASALQARIDALEAEYQSLVTKEGKESEKAVEVDAELEAMREKLHVLKVQGEVNLPDVRWKVANAMADMGNAAHRHLVESRWRKDGDLDLLMERVYQMNVVPDVLPVIRPSLDLKLVVKAKTPEQFKELAGKAKPLFTVEPGTFLDPKNTIDPPTLYPTVFHTDTRLYTLLLVDPDVPDPSSASFKTYLHWLVPNIPLSAASSGQRIPSSILKAHTPYVPPHPQKGTPYHRYTVLLLPQPPLEGDVYFRNTEARAGGEVTSKRLEGVPVVSEEGRDGFDVRAFCEEWGLSGEQGGGVHMFREVWGEGTTKIYNEILNRPEPVFGRPPKPDRYAEIRNRKKYIS